MKSLSLFILLVVFGFSAHAEILTSLSYFQYSRNDQVSTDAHSTESLITSFDWNFQLLISAKYLVGVTHMTQSTSSTIRSQRQTFAPNVGFFLGPLMIEGGPITKSTERIDLTTGAEWRDPSGYYVALTVYDRWADWLLVGFQFTFLDIEYRKYFDGSTEIDTLSKKVSVLNPSLRLSLVF